MAQQVRQPRRSPKAIRKGQVLFADIDGHFPNHHPNPVDPETFDILQRAAAKLVRNWFDGTVTALVLTPKADKSPVIF